MRGRFLFALTVLLFTGTAFLLAGRTGNLEETSPLTLVARARISAVYDIEVVPPYAYALERGILRVLDVRDPAAVREVGLLEFDQPRSRMALHHPYLYLTGFGQSLAVVDITNPTQPRWIRELAEFDGTMNDGFELAGEFAYVLRRVDSHPSAQESAPLLFEVLDLGNPDHPNRLGSIELDIRAGGFGGVGMTQADGRVFVLVARAAEAQFRSQLFVVDCRVPDQPRIVHTLLLPEGKGFSDVEVRGDLLFLLQRRPEQGLSVYQMQAEGDPELLAEVFDPRFWTPIDLIVHGEAIYATFKGEVDLAVFDVSNPRDPKLIHTYTIPDNWAAGLGMTLVENRLYVAGDGGPAPIFDVSEERAPRLLGHWQFEGGWAGDVVREGNLAIVANVGGGLILHDVSDPSAPRRLSRYTPTHSDGLADWQWNVAVAASGSRILVAYQNIPAEVLDVGQPRQPVVLGRFTPRGLVHRAVLTPTHAILGYRDASQGGGVEIIDVSNPRTPRTVAVLDLGQAVTDLALHHDRLVAAHSDGSLTVLDMRDPARPTVLGRLAGSESAETSFPIRSTRIALLANGTRAYVVRQENSASGDPYTGRGILAVVDLQDPSTPRVLGELALDRHVVLEFSLVARGNHLIVFTGDILIVDASDPSRPTVKLRQPFPPARFWVGDWVGLALEDEYLYLGAAEDGLWVYRLPPALR